MIVKNEQHILETSIESIIDAADELIIVDTGSSDKTLEIAQKFTSHIYHFPWIDDFSAAYNYCSNLATMEYVCRWDADFVLQKDSLQPLQDLKQSNFDQANILSFTWNVDIKEQTVLQSMRREFIYLRGKFTWCSPVHAYLKPNAGVKVVPKFFENIQVDHYKDPQIKQYRYQQTADLLEKALQKNPDDEYLLAHKIGELMHQDKFNQAIPVINHYLKVCQNTADEKTVLMLEHLIFAYLSEHQVEKAWEVIEAYEPTLAHFPAFILLVADVVCAVHPSASLQYYQAFVDSNFTPEKTSLPYNHYRYQIYPKEIIAKIRNML
jgi:glycosyltransferase involved in cell wall biosynthesis